MTIEIALLVSGISLAFGIYEGIANMKRNNKKDAQTDATTLTTVIVKLENISTICTEIKADISAVKADVKGLSERLVIVEQSTKSAHKRIDEVVRVRNHDELERE